MGEETLSCRGRETAGGPAPEATPEIVTRLSVMDKEDKLGADPSFPNDRRETQQLC